MGEAKRKHAHIDSKPYKVTLFGILNAYGDFWTPLAFETERQAREHIDRFWGGSHTENAKRCQKSHKIVPVRVRLDHLPTEPHP